MNAATYQLSFAPGNYVTASAFSTNGKDFPEFVATSRLIEKKKAGITRTEAVVITAIDREEKRRGRQSLPLVSSLSSFRQISSRVAMS